MRTPLLTLGTLALAAGLASSVPAAPSEDAEAPEAFEFEVVVLDSPGRPVDELAREAWRLCEHPQARARFRWIRVGSPEGLGLPTGGPRLGAEGRAKDAGGGGPPPLGGAREPRGPDIEWDPRGAHAAAWQVEGVPRVLLVSAGGPVLRRDVHMSTAELRQLCRNPPVAARPSQPPASDR